MIGEQIGITTIPELITRLEEIPGDQWTRNFFKNQSGQKCVMGHIGYIINGDPFSIQADDFVEELRLDREMLVNVNNCESGDLQGSVYENDPIGPKVKGRVINYLKSLTK